MNYHDHNIDDHEDKNQDEYLMSTEARQEYGLTRDMMRKLLKNGTLPYLSDPLDKRTKWVKRTDVLNLTSVIIRLKNNKYPD